MKFKKTLAKNLYKLHLNQNIIIRTATINDLDTLLRFEQGVIAAERPFDPTLKPDPIRYYDLEQMITAPHIELVVAELDGQLIGCGYARMENSNPYLRHKQYAYLGFMYVEPVYRGKGINGLILNALSKWALSQNITEMRLEVYVENNNAITAYKKAGFEKHMLEMRMAL
jgi:GNAT superfamily N-acetyltransferase